MQDLTPRMTDEQMARRKQLQLDAATELAS